MVGRLFVTSSVEDDVTTAHENRLHKERRRNRMKKDRSRNNTEHKNCGEIRNKIIISLHQASKSSMFYFPSGFHHHTDQSQNEVDSNYE